VRDIKRLAVPTLAEVERIVVSQEPSKLADDVKMVGYLAELGEDHLDPATIRAFSINGRIFESTDGWPKFLGTGAERLRKSFDRSVLNSSYSDEPSRELKAVSTALAVCGNLMTHEHTSSQPLLEYFGGGYEIATWDGIRFWKIDNAVHVFCEAVLSGNQLGLRLLRVLRPTYFGSMLIVHAATPTRSKIKGEVIRERYIIPPIHDAPISMSANAETGRFNDADVTCMYLLVLRDNQLSGIASYVHFGSNRAVQVLEDAQGRVHLEFGEEAKQAYIKLLKEPSATQKP
jgi:hypothetical protein